MEAGSRKRKRLCVCIALCMTAFFCHVEAQKPSTAKLPTFLDTDPNPLPNHFAKEKEHGSPYLSTNWVTGNMDLVNHKHIPDSNEVIFFNYDKIESIVYLVTSSEKVSAYPIDSVQDFEIFDNNKVFEFEKVPWISTKFYLTPLFESKKGYSLYKRLVTSFYWADYSTDGYTTKGKKYDQFVDTYIYYLTYPGNTIYKKIMLKENVIKRDLKEESSLIKEFFNLHEDEMDEQSLVALVQYIDDKKYPE